MSGRRFSSSPPAVQLAAGEHEGNGAAIAIGQGMDFGRAAAPRAPDDLILLLPFTAQSRAMRLHGGQVDQNLLGRTTGTGKRVKDIRPPLSRHTDCRASCAARSPAAHRPSARLRFH